jgi:gamma-glutamylcyclotransferase (GGCT)/AIG2-like uncharacterized protein YtfP
MSTLLERIKPLRLYKTKLRYPILNPNNNTTGSIVFILANSVANTIDFLKTNNILINTNNSFKSYYTEKDFQFIIDEATTRFEDGESKLHSIIESTQGEADPYMNDMYMVINHENDLSTKLYYPDMVEELIFNEDFKITQNYPMIFRRLLYEKRIRNQKELFAIYKQVKSELKFIKFTYASLKQYKNKNLILDWSYYTNLFNDNNNFKLDKGIDLFHHLMTKFIDDKRLSEYKRRTVIIPVQYWEKEGVNIFDFKENINPLSMIARLIKKRNNLTEYWENTDFLFMSKNMYFKTDFTNFSLKELYKFIILTNKLLKDDIEEAEDAPNVEEETVVEKEKQQDETGTKKSTSTVSNKKPKEEKYEEPEKVPAENPDEDWIKSVILDLQEEPTTKINEARKQRMEELDKKYDETEIDGKKVKTILSNYYSKPRVLKKESIPVDSINEEWKEIKSLDFNKAYDIDEDIVAILKSFRFKSRPLSVVSMTKEDTSTFEDYVFTLKVTFEDINGTRSNIAIDIPKFINNRLMKLRGNTKNINGTIMLLPIIKTDEDTAQIVTSYRKIFISRVNPSNGSKSTKGVSKLTKALSKINNIEGCKVKVFEGDNSFICAKYDLPIEYRDLAGLYSRISLDDGSYVLFDYDKAQQLPVDSKYNPKIHIIYGYDAKTKKAVYSIKDNMSYTIGNFIADKDKKFGELYAISKPSDKLSYSEASIMSTKIPVIVVMAFSEGLQKSMDKAKIKYKFSESRPKITDTESYIRFKDGYLIYNDEKPEDSLLMSGLSKCDLSQYSIKDINNKSTWLDMLDLFGGRIKADGLDNFYDCEFDPMSIDICKKYDLPYDYIEALAYASSLLASTNYNRHSDISGNRIRTNEIVAGYLYQELCKSYGDYANKSKRTGKGVKFTIKQSAVIDALMSDPGFADFSVNNAILEAESMNTMSFKGLSGMNSDRAYTLDKRIYNDSMLGVLSMSTGFANTSGISRQTTINSNINDTRGILGTTDKKDLTTLKTLSIYEALAPYATTHDDPIRTAMGFTQTKSHQMRVKSSDPNLITYGMDEALPYFTSNIFSYKFDGVKGKVLDVTDDFVIYEKIDENNKKTHHMINIKDTVEKNSDGGFYVTVKLKPTVKKGDILKPNQIMAYDPTSYSKALATDKKSNAISYNIGTLSKVAIMCTDEAYEDSSIITDRLVDALTSFYCVEKNFGIKANANVFDMVKVGQPVEEGQPLIVFQNAFDDQDANILLKNLTDDETELLNDFGRIQIRSKITGIIQDIKIYRTCDIDELSPSLKKIVTNYESNIKLRKKYLLNNGVDELEINNVLDPTQKSEQVGKLKNLDNGVMFCFYIRCADKMGVGDKLVYNTAIKGVVKYLVPKGKEPFSDYRKNEEVDALLTSASVNARMTPSVITCGALNKLIVELTRQCKDILGIKWDYLTNKDNL